MNIIITAGGTSEPIDAVRRITNNSTGALGAMIAKAFLDALGEGAGCNIFYIMAKGAVRPALDSIIEIETVADLDAALRSVLAANRIDVIIHAAAVSDYRVKNTASGKISSDTDEITITLIKAPKLMAMFRSLVPQAQIVGFKLLSDACEAELIDVAYALLQKYDCDYVLANDTIQLDPSNHKGFLIDKNKNIEVFTGKDEIAKAIVRRVTHGK